MNNLTEDSLLRDRIRVFRDRTDAGHQLARHLSMYKDVDGIVLAIPSGGVPVAAEVARVLGFDLDLIIVRKIQIPGNPEAGFGAVGPDGEVLLNRELLGRLHLSQHEIDMQVRRARDIIRQRNDLFRHGNPSPSLRGKCVIIVDDGLASGYTMLSAIEFIRDRVPDRIIAAVPTAPQRSIDLILPHVDELLCLNVRSGFTFAVADAYQNWYDLNDEEVISILGNFS